MGRKKWPKKLVNEVFNKSIYNKSIFSITRIKNKKNDKGRCWHCGRVIIRCKRTIKDGPEAWHIDHYPVQYVDIEDQVCCGVTDQHDISNLVPSCVWCNISHRYEKKHCYYCNRSQILCTKKCITISVILFIMILIIISI